MDFYANLGAIIPIFFFFLTICQILSYFSLMKTDGERRCNRANTQGTDDRRGGGGEVSTHIAVYVR
jgi:hypothetical protein